MFKKFKSHARADSMERFETLIGPGTTVHGRLVLIDSVRIDGKLIGHIETIQGSKATVAIGPMGQVIGNISAFRVIVAGKVEGNIAAVERVELSHDCLVQGDISYGSINVQHGAQLQGLIIQTHPDSAPGNDTANATAAIRRAQEAAKE
jgi:cytoskeletal protein CcmA (bactofilin family)